MSDNLDDLGLGDILGDLDIIEEIEDDTDELIEDVDETTQEFLDIIDDFERSPTKENIASVSAKFDTLSDAFGVSSDAMTENIQEGIDTVRKDAVSYKSAGYEITEDIKASAFNIDLLSNDFAKMREILLDSLADGRAVQKKFTDEMLMVSIDDISPTILEGFSSLMKAVANQVQLLSKIYKDVADTQVKLKQYMRQEQMNEDLTGSKEGTTNIQNNYILSTNDLIKGFLPDK